jgi:hypothetical protein
MNSTKSVIRPEDFLVNHLFEDSKCFLELAKEHEGKDPVTARRYVRASIVTAYAALEAFVNAMLVILEDAWELELHESAFMQEKRVELTEDGYFEIRGRRFRSLEEKIRFLYWRGQRLSIPKGSAVWKALHDATELRNRLVHPRPRQVPYSKLTAATAKACLIAAVKLTEMLGGRATISGIDSETLRGFEANRASGKGN